MIRKRISARDDKTIVAIIEQTLLPFTRKHAPETRIDLKSLRKRLEGGITYVAQATGMQPVGFMTLRHIKTTLYIDMLAIQTRFQKRGYGTLFMQKAERTARLLGCSDLALWVDDTNDRAQRFYMGKGFEATYFDPNIQCYLMSKRIV
ncbi:GNAT family N-acetyltransferase [Paenibacillus thalictri]|uniref:GNAT family N-acetyltransferase n=1 Tax=Paenibacillus thalictri TaxID=2527873 RepID=A0A4Q9DC97_9BACL|nr:GNAT family N-acetyltransferase [Paenibacillus thalictri]TBL67922.1 GNAT family N-acetyltransferase [Paenibacillus thalictri]